MARTCTEQKALKMLVNKPASRRSTESRGKSLGPIGSFDLDAERAQDVDTP